jgi:hypothetical protein
MSKPLPPQQTLAAVFGYKSTGTKVEEKRVEMESIAAELFRGLQTSVSELSAKLAAQEGIINDQKTTIDDQTKLIDEQMRLIEDLRKQLTDTSSVSASNSSSSWADLVKGKSSASTAAVVAIMAKEKRQVEDKEKNVIISGLDEKAISTEDESEVMKVMEVLGVSASVKRIRRIGVIAESAGEGGQRKKNRLVMVELADKEARDKALRSGRELKAGHAGVYVNRDRTQNEMLMERELLRQRDERNKQLENEDGRLRYSVDANSKKWYWGVRWGELRKIDKETGRTLASTRSA